MARPGADYVTPGKNQTKLWSGFRIDNNRGFRFGILLGSKMLKFAGIDLQERLTVFVPEINAQPDESTKFSSILIFLSQIHKHCYNLFAGNVMFL
jgi:hypothetical protein